MSKTFEGLLDEADSLVRSDGTIEPGYEKLAAIHLGEVVMARRAEQSGVDIDPPAWAGTPKSTLIERLDLSRWELVAARLAIGFAAEEDSTDPVLVGVDTAAAATGLRDRLEQVMPYDDAYRMDWTKTPRRPGTVYDRDDDDLVLADVDMDHTERCETCGAHMWQDVEGDWMHVIVNEDGAPVALQVPCIETAV